MPDDKNPADEAQKQLEEANKSLKPEGNPAEKITPEDIAKADEDKSKGLGGLFGSAKPPEPEEIVSAPEISEDDIPGPKGGLF